jgi:hypothetical protein
MLHIVEIRHIGTDLDVARSELKGWLQRHRIDPVEFEHSTGGPGITFRVHFASKETAAAFADAFHGRVNDGARLPEACWGVSP